MGLEHFIEVFQFDLDDLVNSLDLRLHVLVHLCFDSVRVRHVFSLDLRLYALKDLLFNFESLSLKHLRDIPEILIGFRCVLLNLSLQKVVR
jgi:hypothetical protein